MVILKTLEKRAGEKISMKYTRDSFSLFDESSHFCAPVSLFLSLSHSLSPSPPLSHPFSTFRY